MKFSLLALLFSSAALAQPEVILAPVDHLYVPQGFDSNDAVEVVVTGTFPNVCYSRNTVDVKVNGDIIDIEVTALAPDASKNSLNGKLCPAMVVPFKEVITLGNFQGGEYEIRVNKSIQKDLNDKITIAEATSNAVDDNVYAAIDYVEQNSSKDFILKGWKYSNCFELKEVKVVSNKKDTLSILPIMKQVSNHCPMKGMPVAYPVKIDFNTIKVKQPLLHVRTLDGKSVNSIVNLEE